MNAGTPAKVALRARLWAADGLLLGLFMCSVAVFASLLQGARSPVPAQFPDDFVRRCLMGLAMGATAVALIMSPLGAFSGALMNPAVTLAFLRLGKLRRPDAIGYIVAQVIGGTAGVYAGAALVGTTFTAPPVRYAATHPGRAGTAAAFAAEFMMTAALMGTVLFTSNTRRLARWTGAFGGALLCLFIIAADPISGTSLNPARSLASALPAHALDHLWIYVTAPILGMLTAAELFHRHPRSPAIHCCKLNHSGAGVCPHCGCTGPIDFAGHRPPATTVQ
ncbi:MAG: aquaporin [Planctomycetes bacterium]|nr:aquaporin [Planctomycetota bacterium]